MNQNWLCGFMIGKNRTVQIAINMINRRFITHILVVVLVLDEFVQCY